MTISITVNQNDRIVGVNHSGGVPVGNIEISQAEFDAIRTLRQQSQMSGNDGIVLWINGAPELPADNRPIIRVEPAQNRVMIGAPLSITVSRVNGAGQGIATVQGPRVFSFAGRNFLFDFTDGVAARSITFSQSFDWEWRSTPDYRVEAPVDIQVVE